MLTEQEKQKIAEEEKIRIAEQQKQQGMGCLILIGIIMILSLFSLFSNKNKKAEIIDPEILSKIKVTADFQNFYNEKGEQKIVIWVKNNSNKIFNGKIKIRIIDDNNISYARDIFLSEDIQPGMNKWGILWAKPGGYKLDYEIEGELKPLSN